MKEANMRASEKMLETRYCVQGSSVFGWDFFKLCVFYCWGDWEGGTISVSPFKLCVMVNFIELYWFVPFWSSGHYITVTCKKQKWKLSYSLFLSHHVRRGWGGVGSAVELIRKVELTVAEFLVIMWSILSFVWSPTSELERGLLVAHGCQKGDCEDKSLQASFMCSADGSGVNENHTRSSFLIKFWSFVFKTDIRKSQICPWVLPFCGR